MTDIPAAKNQNEHSELLALRKQNRRLRAENRRLQAENGSLNETVQWMHDTIVTLILERHPELKLSTDHSCG